MSAPGSAPAPRGETANGRGDARELPAHVTTPLLSLITQRSLDEDYAAAAARRAAGARPRSPRAMRWASGAALLAAALMATVIGLQTQRDAEVDEMSREALTDQVEARRAALGDLQSEERALRRENQDAMATRGRESVAQGEAEREVERLAASTGFGAVRGPGIRITVEDAENASETDLLRDEDLALLVDGLWLAGAEAIAVNDQRLTAVSGIRNTGTAIRVGGQGVNPPYEIEAIGDNATLLADLLNTPQGQRWYALARALGFTHTEENVEDLRLPAATLGPLRSAVVADDRPERSPADEVAPNETDGEEAS